MDCTIDGCRRPVEAAALCAGHRKRKTRRLPVATAVERRDRLKASELLGRSEADFTEKLEVRGELTLRELVAESREQSVQTSAPKPAELVLDEKAFREP